MKSNLAEALAELRLDHKNIALMLNRLEQESDRVYAGGEADYELLHDVMRYMTVYPDAVHHPKEDRLYDELKRVRPDLSDGLGRIPAEHRDLAELGMKLRNNLESIISGTAVERKVIVADALRYVQRQRDHMHWEEVDLFHRIDEMISDGHRQFIDTVVHEAVDPVFGPQVEKEFGRLFQSINQSLEGP